MSSEAIDRSNILNINVGILGHVDAGKTALVRALSTSLSTAALDKNPQSQQRGITLDLGFSAFTLPIPSHLSSQAEASHYDSIQFTLVDCPGHASLIRTIIGGAQIIDMILLVVDANKGIQTQTAECIVIGEITTDNMIVVLNKVDMIPETEREAKIERVSNRIRKVFSTTKFSGVDIVCTSATLGASTNTKQVIQLHNPDSGIENLMNLFKEKVKVPSRNYSAPFYYAIDHCFSIKGHGTVLTGTVLSGSVSANSIIEIPHLQLQRKVKSLQMFRKPVKGARQGDRVGICVTNLDASLIERGIAAAPGSVPQLHSVVCLVKKVRFFRSACKSMTKFHISIGHSTVIASVVFFGHKQLPHGEKSSDSDPSTVKYQYQTEDHNRHALSAAYHRGFPDVGYQLYDTEGGKSAGITGTASADPSVHYGYEYQDELVSAEGLIYGAEPVQWALLQFQHPVFCPIGSLVIGSRLDTDTTDKDTTAGSAAAGTGSAQQCRLAFYGPVKKSLGGGEADLLRTGVYTWRTKECEVFLLSDSCKGGVCYEAVIWKLVSGGGSVNAFLGLRVETADKRVVGTIISSYGADGKCRVKFPTGVRLSVGEKMLFRYKRYIFDKTKRMVQTGLDELRATEEIGNTLHADASIAGNEMNGVDVDVDADAVDQTRIKGFTGKRQQKHKAAPTAVIAESAKSTSGGVVAVATASLDKEGFGTEDGREIRSMPTPVYASESTTTAAVTQAPPPAPAPALPIPPTVAADTLSSSHDHDFDVRVGVIESFKAEDPCAENNDSTESTLAIVKGAFRMEENVKSFVGTVCKCGSIDGQLVGPFGKLGKCKVRFLSRGIMAGLSVSVLLPK